MTAPARTRSSAHPAAPALPGLPDLDALLASGAIRLPGTAGKRADGTSETSGTQAHVPDFRLYTAAAAVDPDAATSPQTGNPLVHAIGSSTICDLQGDTMELSALHDMQTAPPGLAIFVNHEYTVPEDVVGRLYDYPSVAIHRDIADLALCVELLPGVNPRAAQLAAGITAGVRQGVSIGCMITAAQWYDSDGNPIADDMVDFWDVIEGRVHLHILGVDPLEWSFVGIPANQRSWVQYAAQGIFRRALRSGDATGAQRVAPLVRAWFPTEYTRDVLDIAGSDPALRNTLERTAPRRDKSGTGGKTIIWRPDSATFALRHTAARRTHELSRERVAELLAEAGAATTASGAMQPQIIRQATGKSDPDTQKGACGNTDWPLADRDEEWDGEKAHNQIVDWAKKDDDSVDVAKMKSVHFWYDDSAPDKITSYKMPFCYIRDGKPVAVPRGIFAVAGALQGARG